MTRPDEIRLLEKEEWPAFLHEITDPPSKLFVRGVVPPSGTHFLSVVGSRKYSPYAKSVCERLIAGLSGYPISIVSGLALGIDGIAHEAALAAGLHTIAVPGSGLSDTVLYPRAHLPLARRIIQSGGALISEFEHEFKATDWSFPQRNRVMAGMSHAVLIIEAGEKSGTLITARLGMEYGRRVLVVPSPLFTPYGKGSNALLRVGAELITSSSDILEALGIEEAVHNEKVMPLNISDDEKKILEVLNEPLQKDQIIARADMPARAVLVLLSTLEIKGIITERLGKIERVR